MGVFIIVGMFFMQIISGGPWSVQSSIEYAEENNAEIQQLRFLLKAQEEQQVLSLGIQDPQILYFDEGINDGFFVERRWTISQQLDFPLTSYYRYKAAKQTTSSVRFRLDDQLLALKERVKSAYVNVLLAEKIKQISIERSDLFKNISRIAERRVEEGQASEVELLQAEIQLQEAENAKQIAEARFQSEVLEFYRILGIKESNQELELSDAFQYQPISISKEELMSVISEYPILMQRNALDEAALLRRKTAKSTYLPNLNLSYYRQNYGNDFDFYGFQVGVSVPLWFGLNQSRQVKLAGANLKNVEWRSFQVIQQLNTDAENAWNNYEAASENMDRYSEEILEKSNRLIEKTKVGYETGQFSLLMLLEAQRTYLRSMEMYYSNLRDYHLSVFRIERFSQKEWIYYE